MDKLIGMLVVAAIFIPVERKFALRRQRLLRAGWKTDTLHFLFSNVLSELCSFVPVGLAIAVTRPLIDERLVSSQPRALQLVEMVFVVELTGYWSHRAMHEIPMLWRVHQLHHSSRHLDWLAAARVHPFDQLLARGAGFMVLRLVGFGPMLLQPALVLLGLWAIFLHSNVRLRFPRLERLFATPAFHHWHHSNDLEARDKNFAGLFPIVDRIFGTLHLPSDRWPETYGTDEPLGENYVKQLSLRASLPGSSTARPSPSPPPAQ